MGAFFAYKGINKKVDKKVARIIKRVYCLTSINQGVNHATIKENKKGKNAGSYRGGILGSFNSFGIWYFGNGP